MQHSEPFENEALMSEEDHIKLQKIAKGLLFSMLLASTSIIGYLVTI